MARHSARVRRLVTQVRGRHADLRQARLARLSPEELVAEVRQLAQRFGYPVDPFPEDVNEAMSAAALWLSGKLQAMSAALPEEQREELLTRFPHLRRPLPRC